MSAAGSIIQKLYIDNSTYQNTTAIKTKIDEFMAAAGYDSTWVTNNTQTIHDYVDNTFATDFNSQNLQFAFFWCDPAAGANGSFYFEAVWSPGTFA